MLNKLISTLAHWLGSEAERQTEAAIISGVQRGCRNAVLRLTGGELDPESLLTVQAVTEARGERLEARPPVSVPPADANPAPELPTFTRTQIHALRREELLELVSRYGWQIDIEASVKDIKAAVLDAMEL